MRGRNWRHTCTRVLRACTRVAFRGPGGMRHLALAAVVIACGLGWVPSAALALPEGRAYEMVSPPYKGGYGANPIDAVAPNGESVAFLSQGAFAGEPFSGINGYLARRGETGWSTAPLAAPASILPFATGNVPEDYSATLETSLTSGVLGPNLGRASGTRVENVFLLHPSSAPDVATNFEVAGEVLTTLTKGSLVPGYDGASPDFSHILFHTTSEEQLLPPPGGVKVKSEHQLYDLVSRGAGAHPLSIVGLNDNGELIDPYCSDYLGSSGSPVGSHSMFNAISADGSEIFFMTSANLAEGESCERSLAAQPRNPEILFVRVDNERTLQISGSGMRSEFQGANEAGTCVFFTTSQPLVSGDTDDGNDLYVARIGHQGEEVSSPCAPAPSEAQGPLEVTSLAQVSHDPSAGEAAEVQGVVATSPDGSRVYFVARGRLNGEANTEGRIALAGADNLYVYDTASDGQPPVFVTDLCSGPEESGGVREARCPSDLESADGGERNDVELVEGALKRETAADGRFLLFSSYGRLLPGDTDTAEDVYLYDAASGRLERVSAGEAGYDVDGNSSVCDGSENACNASIRGEEVVNGGNASAKAGLRRRAINEEGTRVVFTTAAPLSPQALNGLENVYEWHKQPDWSEGRVSLVSSGISTQPVNDVVMSQSGDDVFFVTNQGLVPQDSDGVDDVYDARLGGGFPAPPASVESCEGDACQGPLTNPAPLLVPGSVSQAPGGNFSPAHTVVKAKSKKKPQKRKKISKKRAKAKKASHSTRGSK